MNWRVYDQRFPWVLWAEHQGGYAMHDRRSGEQAWGPDWTSVARFAAAHSSAEGYVGAGDMVHAVTSAMGMEQCLPCAKRHAEMNQWLRLRRRR